MWSFPVLKDSNLWTVVLWHSVYWWFGRVWSKKSIASAKESSFTYLSVSYWLVCHTGVNWKGETLTVNHSFSPFPLVPHATVLLYPVLVVLSTFDLHWPRFPIIWKKNDLVLPICFFTKNRWPDLLTHWTHKTSVLSSVASFRCSLSHLRLCCQFSPSRTFELCLVK